MIPLLAVSYKLHKRHSDPLFVRPRFLWGHSTFYNKITITYSKNAAPYSNAKDTQMHHTTLHNSSACYQEERKKKGNKRYRNLSDQVYSLKL